MHFDVPVKMDKTIEWYNRNQQRDDRIDFSFFDSKNEIVAFGGITSIDNNVRKGETYIFTKPNAQHKGIGTEAMMLLCKYGFETLGLNKLFAFTNEDNMASIHLHLKVGYEIEGRLRKEYRDSAGVLKDRIYFGFLKDSYKEQKMSNRTWLSAVDCSIDRQRLIIVRDDIFPFIGGGGKARKAVYYEELLREQGFNAVVTCGGIQSNHNRAIALMCAKNGWKCHLCIQGTEERFFAEKGNALLDRLSGAECELIRPEDTAEAMDRAMDRLTSEGYKPYYCHGGGHDLPGGIAFVDAVEELAKQIEKPDYIFHASGTGSTQAGIVVGLERVGWGDVKCIGISVARQYERGRQVIADFANTLADHYGMTERYDDRILFNTDYLCGGYEQFTPKMDAYLQEAMKETGLMFDTTYSGKAFYGMMDYIKKHDLQDKKIVFWHTGGIMNIMK